MGTVYCLLFAWMIKSILEYGHSNQGAAMANRSNEATEIWELIKQYQIQNQQYQTKNQIAAEKFRADMQDFHAGMKELRASQKETEKLLKQSTQDLKEALRETAEEQKKTEQQMQQSDRRFNTQWGRLVESLVEGSLVPLLKGRDIEVHQTARNIEASFVNEAGELKRKEFDILVVNGTEVVVVEVKTTLTPDKVRYFVSALEDFKRYCRQFSHHDVYGAVAYIRSEAEAALYAERQGLFVIRATGDSASIVNSEEFLPKRFSTQGTVA